ncbi:MAG: hypothetical protein KGD57_09125 [Candidatus Lokiarchaeota archaeon]|nr:hypothetical protein [Candidatus Lokiarchaeota archaeon]
MSQKDLIDQIILVKNELKDLDAIYKEKESVAKSIITKEFKSNFKNLETKLITERKELNNITDKINRDRKRFNHLDLSTLKTRKNSLKVEIKKNTLKLKEINKERDKAIDKKIKEILKEKDKKRKNNTLRLKKLIKEYESLKKLVE